MARTKPGEEISAAEIEFLRRLRVWQGVATHENLGVAGNKNETRICTRCKHKGFVTYDGGYWRITDLGNATYTAYIEAGRIAFRSRESA